MKSLTVSLPGRSYPIHISPGLLNQAGSLCRRALPSAGLLAVVTDSHVGPLYASRLLQSLEQAGFRTALLTVPAGESSKSLSTLETVYDGLLAAGLTRGDAVVALGGGVVGDLAGFAAATLLRGVPYVQIPTTLLAQVDSSVGGKVAVDLKQGKNLAGAFWQPRMVLIDPLVLNTLEDAAFADGMAEVIKYGCIALPALFEKLEAAPSRQAVMDWMEDLIWACCDCKRNIVERDERDTGLRMLLNFGHTLGHAYELAGNYTACTHGQGVAAGMCQAARLGVALGITPRELPGRIAALVTAFGLPDRLSCTPAQYAAAIGADKKGAGDRITLILLARLGRALPYPMEKAALLRLIEELDL